MARLTHATVQRDLAEWLRNPRGSARPPVVAEELAIDGSWGSHGRLDVLLFRALNGYKQIILEGYEVKATRADFLADLRAGKWKRYLPRLTRFYFAAPEGIIKEGELPGDAGLIERGVRGDGRFYWHRVRRAPSLLRLTDSQPVDLDTLARILYKVNTQRHEEGWRQAVIKKATGIYPHIG